MTKLYIPFDAGAGANVTEAGWRKMAKMWASDGPLYDYLNQLQVYGDASGMQVKIRTGGAWCGGHYYENDAEETKAIAAAHATLNRLDLVILRADFTANTVDTAVVSGTATASPSLLTNVSALTKSSTLWEIPLAAVYVPAADTSIAANQVADLRTMVVPQGRVSGVQVRKTGHGGGVVSWTSAPSWDSDSYVTLTNSYIEAPFTGLYRVWADTNGTANDIQFLVTVTGPTGVNGLPVHPVGTWLGSKSLSVDLMLIAGAQVQVTTSSTGIDAGMHYLGAPDPVVFCTQ